MIDPRAIVDPSAEVADDVYIGPWSIIGPNVKIGSGTRIESHVVVKGPSEIGRNNRFYQFSTVGEDTPDMKYRGEPTKLIMGDNNIVRECVTIHRGTVQDLGETRIGNNNLFMACSHVGHDCIVGNHCVMVNNSGLAGHVRVGDWAILAGFAGIHQFCNVGEHAFVGMASVISKDVPAYVMVGGVPPVPKTINVEGLKRRGFSKDEIAIINKAYKIIYRRRLTLDEALQQLKELSVDHPVVQPMIDSIELSSRGILR